MLTVLLVRDISAAFLSIVMCQINYDYGINYGIT